MKHRKLAITLIIIVSVIALVAGAIALDLFGLKTTLRYYTGYPYPLTPRIKDIEDFEELCGFDFADDAVLEKVMVERSFGPGGWPRYVETDLWVYDSVITMSEESAKELVSELDDNRKFEKNLEIQFSDFAAMEANGKRYNYIYFGDEAGYSWDIPWRNEVTRGGGINLATVFFVRINDDYTATVCVSRMGKYGPGFAY
ncbi:MAG: hypothetical protein IKK26_00805 [Clostridia bacterium]|nr:hypothetical protein [Clostridia bacterium]